MSSQTEVVKIIKEWITIDNDIRNINKELRLRKEKLKKIQPRTLGQASRISGINPSDVQILMVYMGR